MEPIARVPAALLHVFLLLISLGPWLASGQQSPASACGEMLKAGIYNYYSYTMSSQAASQMQSAACKDYSNYSYDDYKNDIARGSSNSDAKQICAAVKYTNAITNVDVEGCYSSSQSMMTQEQFNTAKTKISEYKSKECSSEGRSGLSQDYAQTMTQNIDPNVYQAYVTCLQLANKAGITVSTSYGARGDNVAVGFQFQQQQAGSYASLTGIDITPAGAAACKVTPVYVGRSRRLDEDRGVDSDLVSSAGAARQLAAASSKPPSPPRPPPRRPPPPPSSGDAQTTFPIAMSPLNTYTIFCKADPAYKPAGNSAKDYIVDIAIANSVSMTPLYLRLYLQQDITDTVAVLQSQLSTVLTQFAALQAQFSQVQAQLSAAQSQVATTQEQLAAVQAQVKPNMVCFGDICLDGTSPGAVEFKGRNSNNLAARIDTRPGASVFTAWPSKNSSTGRFYFINDDDGGGQAGFWDINTGASLGTFYSSRTCYSYSSAERDWNLSPCVGTQSRPDTRDVIGGADGSLLITNRGLTSKIAAFSTNPQESDVLKIFKNRNGQRPFFYVSNRGSDNNPWGEW